METIGKQLGDQNDSVEPVTGEEYREILLQMSCVGSKEENW